jgi:ketosteroid isomerase-like protein
MQQFCYSFAQIRCKIISNLKCGDPPGTTMSGLQGAWKSHSQESEMFQEAPRGFVHAFCDAMTSRDPGRIAPFLDDDVEWMVFGPIDLFPFFGQRKGKVAVLVMFRELMSVLQLRRCEHDSLLTDGDNTAALVRINALDMSTGRVLSLRLAKFAKFRDGKLYSLKAVFDSFDVAEQAIGRPIDLTRAA